MENDVGFACGRCDRYAPLEADLCPSCGNPLGFGGVVLDAIAPSIDPPRLASAPDLQRDPLGLPESSPPDPLPRGGVATLDGPDLEIDVTADPPRVREPAFSASGTVAPPRPDGDDSVQAELDALVVQSQLDARPAPRSSLSIAPPPPGTVDLFTQPGPMDLRLRAPPTDFNAADRRPAIETTGLEPDVGRPSRPYSAAPGQFLSDAPRPSRTSIVPTPVNEIPSLAFAQSDPDHPFVGPVRIPAGFVLTESLMEQARSYVCRNPICHTPVPPGHKFCGRCGESVPREILTAQTLLMSRMLEPGKAKLVVIKGEGIASDASDETAFLLGGRNHLCGRTEGQILFERDNWVSPRHANFYYRDDGKLVLRDEGSINGVYVRVRQPSEITVGDTFLAGEQAFRLEAAPRAADQPDAEGTQFYSSPKRQATFRIAQVLRGGHVGMVYGARESTVTIGRDNCDMNFPNDPYMSGRHCKIEIQPNGRFNLSDFGSKNGTYARLRGERELQHGDYVFIGRELLRVDISA